MSHRADLRPLAARSRIRVWVRGLPSWLETKITGIAWLTEGNLGIEAPYVALALSPAAGMTTVFMTTDRWQVAQALWVRRRD